MRLRRVRLNISGLNQLIGCIFQSQHTLCSPDQYRYIGGAPRYLLIAFSSMYPPCIYHFWNVIAYISQWYLDVRRMCIPVSNSLYSLYVHILYSIYIYTYLLYMHTYNSINGFVWKLGAPKSSGLSCFIMVYQQCPIKIAFWWHTPF